MRFEGKIFSFENVQNEENSDQSKIYNITAEQLSLFRQTEMRCINMKVR